jgi:hypothetical protein
MRLLPEVTVLLQGGIRIGLQLRLQSRFQWLTFEGTSSGNRLGPDVALLSSLFDVPFDRCQGNIEVLHNLLARFPLVDGKTRSRRSVEYAFMLSLSHMAQSLRSPL